MDGREESLLASSSRILEAMALPSMSWAVILRLMCRDGLADGTKEWMYVNVMKRRLHASLQRNRMCKYNQR